jgi:membrane-associated protease RseP (regulator of RpoE activity)
MRKSIFMALLILPLLAVAMWAFQPSAGPYVYSSEDFFSGGSYLGVDTRDVTSDRLGELKLKEERGVEITMVDQDAPAGKSGLKEHDVILTLNGSEVESVEQLRRMIHEIPPGRVVTLGVSRDGQAMTIKAQLADRKKTFAFPESGRAFKFAMPAIPAIPAMPAMPDLSDVPMSVVVVHSSTRSGLMVENLTPQLGDFFGTKNGHGVLVRSVEKGSRADKAGFHAGDVIVRVNGEAVSDTGDFSHALRSRKDNNSASVTVLRDKKEQTLTLSLPERNHSELMDESFEVPEIDEETRIELGRVDSEIARAKPEIERAAREMSLRTAEIERLKPEIDRATEEIRRQQEEFNQEMREMQRELRDELRDQKDELQDEVRTRVRPGEAEI